MDARIKWTYRYLTGIEEIDFQHQYFATLINRLWKKLTSSQDKIYRERIIDELNKYAHFHFLSEENLMMEIGYPGLRDHQKLHYELLEQLNLHCMRLDMDEILPEEIVDFLVDWFMRHTAKEDRKIGKFAAKLPES